MSVNRAIADLLEQIAAMQELLGEEPFRAISNARAARTIGDLSYDVASIAGDRARLLEIPGVGKGIADKIAEYCTTGKIKEHAELSARVPPGLLVLMKIPGLGPKTARLLWKERGVTDIDSLKKIIDDGSILTVPRMGAKTVENLKASLAFAQTSGQRLSLGLAMPVARLFVERLRKVKGVERIAFAGSLRRGKETIGDIDILIATSDPAGAAAAFRAMPEVRQVLVAGETKSSVRVGVTEEFGRWKLEGVEGDVFTGPSIQVDLRVVPLASWGAALMYFTGSKEHNIRLRERALRKQLTLNEYGLFPLDDDETPPQHRGVKPRASKTEEEVYQALGLPLIPPELREAGSELALTETPRLIELADIKAELHAHTTASDGLMSIEELAARAKERGFHTIAVTDHSKSSIQANGLSVERLHAHIEAVHKARTKVKGITILAGSEVDIHGDGRLDYDDKLLAQLDLVVASPHSGLSQDPETCTKRLVAAIENPYVNILGHPTGRLINRRPGLSPDIACLIAAAREHHVALEINAHWMRLDLRDTHVKAAVDAGCPIAIDCDVHAPEDFDNLLYGITTARRGWLTPDLCINTWPARKLHAWLKAKRAKV